MEAQKLRDRADAMEEGLGVTFGDTPMALRQAADEIDRLSAQVARLRDFLSCCGHDETKL